jgi:hypothetical protein
LTIVTIKANPLITLYARPGALDAPISKLVNFFVETQAGQQAMASRNGRLLMGTLTPKDYVESHGLRLDTRRFRKLMPQGNFTALLQDDGSFRVVVAWHEPAALNHRDDKALLRLLDKARPVETWRPISADGLM